jgi:uroporphyrinogen-III synthase
VAHAPELTPQFTPSKANAETLSAELPLDSGAVNQILYPASLKAKNTLQDGLEARGCTVTRLNTYSTERVQEVTAEELQKALECSVVAIASPSALKAWLKLAGRNAAESKMTACIGSTSGKAALEMGLPRELVVWSNSPGLQGLVESIETALETGSAVQA